MSATAVIPKHMRWRRQSDMLAVSSLDDLSLSLEFKARATVLTHTLSEDELDAAREVERVLSKTQRGQVTIRDQQWRSSQQSPNSQVNYFGHKPLPQALQTLIEDRVSRLRQIAAARYETEPERFSVEIEMLSRSKSPFFHRDPEEIAYVETLLGPGTRFATKFGDNHEWAARFANHQLSQGQAILFNLNAGQQPYHAGPRPDKHTPRLGIGIFLDR
jgi:hypothetical protein